MVSVVDELIIVREECRRPLARFVGVLPSKIVLAVEAKPMHDVTTGIESRVKLARQQAEFYSTWNGPDLIWRWRTEGSFERDKTTQNDTKKEAEYQLQPKPPGSYIFLVCTRS